MIELLRAFAEGAFWVSAGVGSLAIAGLCVGLAGVALYQLYRGLRG